MQILIRRLIVCATIACAGSAPAAPRKAPRTAPAAKASPAPKLDLQEQRKLASKHRDGGDLEAALEAIDRGLAVERKDPELLYLRCVVRFDRSDYDGALAACEAFVAVSDPGAKRDHAKKLIDTITVRRTTFLEVEVTNGPASVYLPLVSRNELCRAAPSCKREVSPGAYKVTVERPGYDRWTDRVVVDAGKTRQLAVTLTQKPSLLTVLVTPPEASVTVDDAPYEAPAKVSPGKHRVVVSREGYAEERREVLAREGKPIDLDLTLAAIVPLRIAPPTRDAELLLDGKLVELRDGGIAVPPGARELRVRAPGHHDEHVQIPAERGDGYRIAVRLRPLPPPGAGGDRAPLSVRRKLAIAAGGASATAAVAGVVLGLWARQLAGDALALCPPSSVQCTDAAVAGELNERGRSRALHANVAFGVAGGAALTAAVLWLTGRKPEARAPRSRVTVAPRLGASAGLDLAVRF